MPLSHFVTAYPSPSPCPPVHSLHLRLYFCPGPRFFRTISFFSDSIYMCEHMVFVFQFFTYFTLYDSKSIHLTTNNSILFLFMVEKYSIVYTCHIFFIHSSVNEWIKQLRLLPCPGYCKQRCNEHCGTRLFLNYSFLRVYTQ